MEKYLRECLNSCLNQNISYDKYEIICVDDGSTDNSGKICDEYLGLYSNIVVIHKENGGVSSARNIGLDSSKGEYIWFVDSDDFITYNCLSGIINFLNDNNPDLLFVKPIAFSDSDDTADMKNGLVVENETTKKYWDWLWTRIIKRNLIINNSIYFNPNISFAEDHMFCTMLNPYIDTILSYNKIVYNYRIRANSLSTTPVEHKLESLIQSSKEFLDRGYDGTIDVDIAIKEVCSNMISVMFYLAKLPVKRTKETMRELRSLQLFPIKKQKSFTPEYDFKDKSIGNRILIKLKNNCYTERGYYELRIWRYILKIIRRLSIHRN